MPLFGEVDGFGRYGLLEETDDGLLCAACGWIGTLLGLHPFRAHGMTASQYRTRYGLLRGRGLVAVGTRGKIQDNARAGMSARRLFVERHDPAAASRARHRRAQPASPEEVAGRDARMASLGRRARIETVITCAECAVRFCPLGDKRRRCCTRSCGSRHNRRKPLQ